MIRKNTAVTVEGDGRGLRSNIDIFDSNGNSHRLIFVAMMSGQAPEAIGKTTTVLIEGNFDSDVMILKSQQSYT
jgi:hypothetical protein